VGNEKHFAAGHAGEGNEVDRWKWDRFSWLGDPRYFCEYFLLDLRQYLADGGEARLWSPLLPSGVHCGDVFVSLVL
jgi:hypothetical protein